MLKSELFTIKKMNHINSTVTCKRHLDMKFLVDFMQDGVKSMFGVQRRQT